MPVPKEIAERIGGKELAVSRNDCTFVATNPAAPPNDAYHGASLFIWGITNKGVAHLYYSFVRVLDFLPNVTASFRATNRFRVVPHFHTLVALL